jgi:hypothetical protein
MLFIHFLLMIVDMVNLFRSCVLLARIPGAVIQTVLADSLQIEVSLMNLVILYESLLNDGIIHIHIKDPAALLTFEVGVRNEIGFVANLALVYGETQNEASFLEEIEGVVYRCLRKGWNLPDQLTVYHVSGRVAEIVQEVFQYPKPLIRRINTDL